jgi:hypothetical protein
MIVIGSRRLMKQPSRNLGKRQWWLLVVAGVLLLSMATYAFYRQIKNDETGSAILTPTVTPPISDGNQAKVDNNTRATATPTVVPNVSPSQSKPTATPAAVSLSAIITQASQSGDKVQIRTVVSGANTGSCRLVATGPGNQITKTTAIRFEPPSTYVCDGLDIPVSEFSAGGTWKLSLTAMSGASTSAAFTQSISITK